MSTVAGATSASSADAPHVLRVRRIGIDTYQEPVIYMRADCAVCRSEGFASQSRVRVAAGERAIVATLDIVQGDLVRDGEVGLSEVAWRRLGAADAEFAILSHPDPLDSFGYVRAKLFTSVGERLGFEVAVEVTDGSQPVGRGIGPALEARDVVAVLKGEGNSPPDLRERAVHLAGRLLEIAGAVSVGDGREKAGGLLESGVARVKFRAICEAQGGLREPPVARHRRVIGAPRAGAVLSIDNRRLARVAKLAGAPDAKAAGVEPHIALGQQVSPGEPLYTVHADTPGELANTMQFLASRDDVILVGSWP